MLLIKSGYKIITIGKSRMKEKHLAGLTLHHSGYTVPFLVYVVVVFTATSPALKTFLSQSSSSVTT